MIVRLTPAAVPSVAGTMRAMDWIALLDDGMTRFAGVLEEGDLAADVPACPGWSLADLGEHLRTTHLWAAGCVVSGRPDGTAAAGPLDREALVPGYRSAALRLLDVLSSTPEDGPAWTFGTDQVAGFWRRRQAHETWLHLWDALASQGREAEWSIEPELAWDGVDEVATVFYPRQVRLGRIAPLAGTLRLAAADLDEVRDIGTGDPVGVVAGPAVDVLLTLWKRAPAPDPVAAGLLATAVTP